MTPVSSLKRFCLKREAIFYSLKNNISGYILAFNALKNKNNQDKSIGFAHSPKKGSLDLHSHPQKMDKTQKRTISQTKNNCFGQSLARAFDSAAENSCFSNEKMGKG